VIGKSSYSGVLHQTFLKQHHQLTREEFAFTLLASLPLISDNEYSMNDEACAKLQISPVCL
jgi:hypothetical protein